jgi:hypothetical protein
MFTLPLKIILNNFVLQARQRALTALYGQIVCDAQGQSRAGNVAWIEEGDVNISAP